MHVKQIRIPAHAEDVSYYYRVSGLKLIRPMTLTGTLTPVLAASALAALRGPFHTWMFISIIAASLMIQSGVNILNDYFDFLKGQDKEKWITEKEGIKHGPVFQLLPVYAAGLFIAALLIGGWIVFHSHTGILLAGLAGVALGVFYSAGSKPLSALGLGELTAAATMGTIVPWTAYLVQGNGLDATIVFASLPFAFLIASMILTNNIRDLQKDAGFRKTLTIRIGKGRAVSLLTVLLAASYATVLLLALTNMLPIACLVIFLALPLAIKLLRGVKLEGPIKQLPIMKWAAWHHWAFGLLYAAALWITVLTG